MLVVSILYIYTIRLYTMVIDKPINDKNDAVLTNTDTIVTLLSYQILFYMSYLFVFLIMYGKMYGKMYGIDCIGPKISLVAIKIYNSLLILTAKQKTIAQVNEQIVITWLFSAPLVLILFSQTLNVNMNRFVCREVTLHLINIVYNMFEWSTYTSYILVAMMYVLYTINLIGMYQLHTPNKYLLLYGWIMVGICETVYIVGLIDMKQHIIACILNDMLVKGIIYGVLSSHEMVNQYSVSKIQVNHLQIMNDICKLIGNEECGNIILNQIKVYLNTIVCDDNVIRGALNEMSEMVFCKHFSIGFTRSLLSSKSVRVEDVCILFSDIVKYSELCNNNDTNAVLVILDSIYKSYDTVLQQYPSLQKIENIGDCYFVTSKLDASMCSFDVSECLDDIVRFSCSITRLSKEQDIDIRVGLHIGNVSVGIIGKDIPRFAVVGKDVNIAARLEGTCNINKIHASKNISELIYIHNTIGVKLTNEQTVTLKNIGDYTTYTIDPYDCNIAV